MGRKIVTMLMMKKIHSLPNPRREKNGVSIFVVEMMTKPIYMLALNRKRTIAPTFFAQCIEIQMDHALM
jgi:hypothetical protein